MKKLLVCQHVAHEVLGTLDPLFRSAGFRIRYVNFGRDPQASPELEGYDGLVILGGPMMVGESDRYPHIATEIALVREAVDRDVPVLGICLGAQLIAAALGAEVGPAPRKEIGWYDLRATPEGREDPLFRHLEGDERIFQWHGDAFAIPEGAVRLAENLACPNQAFRFGDKVYGLQFHLEVDEAMIQRWLKVPDLAAEMATTSGIARPEEILAETAQNIARTQELSALVFGAMIELFEPPRRGPVLGSR